MKKKRREKRSHLSSSSSSSWLSWLAVWLTAHAEIYFSHLQMHCRHCRHMVHGSVAGLIWHRHQRLVTETENSKTSNRETLAGHGLRAKHWNSLHFKWRHKFHAISFSLGEKCIHKSKIYLKLKRKRAQQRQAFSVAIAAVACDAETVVRFRRTCTSEQKRGTRRQKKSQIQMIRRPTEWKVLNELLCAVTHIKMTFLVSTSIHLFITMFWNQTTEDRALLKYHWNVSVSCSSIVRPNAVDRNQTEL